MIGGLLFRFWDGGRRVIPVPPEDGLPGGLENTARNVRVKWLTKQTEGLPVPLRVIAERASTQAEAYSPLAWASVHLATPATAQAHARPVQPRLHARTLVGRAGAASGTGGATTAEASMPPNLHATARPAGRRVSQRERNRAAAEAAIRLMFGD